MDWRKFGVVSKIKDQGVCGGCWAFSTIGAMESHYRLKFGIMKLLSEQNLIDCYTDTSPSNGCKGGSRIEAYQYAKNIGVAAERDYKYKGYSSSCKIKDFNRHLYNLTKIKYYKTVSGDEKELTRTIYKHGPVSAVIFNVGKELLFYRHGVYEGRNETHAKKRYSHGVLIVGFGYDKAIQKDYYLIKNSWGKYWGNHGYMKLARHTKKYHEHIEYGLYPIF